MAVALDPDRSLALSYVPHRLRPGLDALWMLDAALGQLVRTAREPMVARIKLAWWREALEALDHGPPPPEPVLVALAQEVLPNAVAGQELARMVDAWDLLLEPTLEPEALDAYAAARGGILFELSARLLGDEAFDVKQPGEAWALIELARNSSRAAEAGAARASAYMRTASRRWPVRLRPLGMLAALAERDAKTSPGRPEPAGAPRRMLRMLRHRLTGR